MSRRKLAAVAATIALAAGALTACAPVTDDAAKYVVVGIGQCVYERTPYANTVTYRNIYRAPQGKVVNDFAWVGWC